MTTQTLAQCHGKLPYDSPQAARRAQRQQGRRRHGFPTSVYRCGSCGSWHIGASRPKPRPQTHRDEEQYQ